MSTLQHTHHRPVSTRLVLIVVMAAAIAALAVVLIASSGGGSSIAAPDPHPSQATIERQLEAVNGGKYGIPPRGQFAPGHTQRATPHQQLQAVAGARYQLRVGAYAGR
jgi:hypothetical protein